MAAEDENWIELADLIDQRLAELGWSQADLSRASRVNANTLRALQRHERQSYRANTLREISRALGWAPMAIEGFLGGGPAPVVGDRHVSESDRRRAYDEAAPPKALSGKIERLSDADRAYVEGLVDRLLGEREA